ncbi:MSS1_1 [Sanghuangporus vaninii]
MSLRFPRLPIHLSHTDRLHIAKKHGSSFLRVAHHHHHAAGSCRQTQRVFTVHTNSALPDLTTHRNHNHNYSSLASSPLPPSSPPSSASSSASVHVPIPSDAQRQTIYALATPPGKGGVAIIRISGPDARVVFGRIVRPLSKSQSRSLAGYDPESKGKGKGKEDFGLGAELELEPRKMVRCTVVDPVSGEALDDGLAVFFKAPNSFTTEDVLELHLHSGRAVISSVLSALQRLSVPQPSSSRGRGIYPDTEDERPLLLRQAERGEFTRRAYLGGRLDLTQAEALRDLIDAETEAQRRVALSAARGSARAKFESIRGEIIRAMAMTEALIDFGEGEDLEEGVFDQARRIVRRLHDNIVGYLADSRRGEILRSGIRLAIFGPPNAGKSSLLNYLAGREAAIVTPIPGTTRDVVELTLDIGGLPVVVADTAGLRKTQDAVERIGVERAQERVAESDVSLCVLSIPDILGLAAGEGDGDGDGDGDDEIVHVPEAVREMMTRSTDAFVLLNKTDLCSAEDRLRAERALAASISLSRSKRCAATTRSGTGGGGGGVGGIWSVSLTCGEGLDRFLSEFGRALGDRYMLGREDEVVVSNARQRAQMERAQEYLASFLGTGDVVVAAEELRYAANAIGKITGVIDVEDVLDVIFREFCIGK